MESEQASLLGRKIECARFDLAFYPLLSELSSILGNACASVLAEKCRQEVSLRGVSTTMRARQNTFEDFPEGAALYKASGADETDATLICMSSTLANTASVCFLGGGFAFSESEAGITTLDLDLAQIIVDGVISQLNTHLMSRGKSDFVRNLDEIQSNVVDEDILKTIPASILFGVKSELEIGETAARETVSLYFPVSLIERLGFLEKVRPNANEAAQQTQWQTDILANIEQSRIDLEVELCRHKTTISELSRLDVGQFVPLDGVSLGGLDIMLRTESDLMRLGTGRLGKYNKLKAVRLNSDLHPTPLTAA